MPENSDHPTQAGMTRRPASPARPLLWLNGGLLLALAAVHFGPAATAQTRGDTPNRGRGEYLLLAGEPEDGNLADLFVIDTANQEVVTLRWDPQRGELTGVGYRNLAADLAGRSDR